MFRGTYTHPAHGHIVNTSEGETEEQALRKARKDLEKIGEKYSRK
jgi:hypothetical protein